MFKGTREHAAEARRELRRRAAVDILILAAAFWPPWWVAIACGAAAFFFFNDYAELLLWGLVIDTLYAPHQTFAFASYQYFGVCIALFLAFSIIKRQLR